MKEILKNFDAVNYKGGSMFKKLLALLVVCTFAISNVCYAAAPAIQAEPVDNLALQSLVQGNTSLDDFQKDISKNQKEFAVLISLLAGKQYSPQEAADIMDMWINNAKAANATGAAIVQALNDELKSRGIAGSVDSTGTTTTAKIGTAEIAWEETTPGTVVVQKNEKALKTELQRIYASGDSTKNAVGRGYRNREEFEQEALKNMETAKDLDTAQQDKVDAALADAKAIVDAFVAGDQAAIDLAEAKFKEFVAAYNNGQTKIASMAELNDNDKAEAQYKFMILEFLVSEKRVAAAEGDFQADNKRKYMLNNAGAAADGKAKLAILKDFLNRADVSDAELGQLLMHEVLGLDREGSFEGHESVIANIQTAMYGDTNVSNLGNKISDVKDEIVDNLAAEQGLTEKANMLIGEEMKPEQMEETLASLGMDTTTMEEADLIKAQEAVKNAIYQTQFDKYAKPLIDAANATSATDITVSQNTIVDQATLANMNQQTIQNMLDNGMGVGIEADLAATEKNGQLVLSKPVYQLLVNAMTVSQNVTAKQTKAFYILNATPEQQDAFDAIFKVAGVDNIFGTTSGDENELIDDAGIAPEALTVLFDVTNVKETLRDGVFYVGLEKDKMYAATSLLAALVSRDASLLSLSGTTKDEYSKAVAELKSGNTAYLEDVSGLEIADKASYDAAIKDYEKFVEILIQA